MKKFVQLFLCSIVMENIQIFCGGPVMFVDTGFWVVVIRNGCIVLYHGTLKSAAYISRMNR